jgi:hypothetical protein
MNLFDDIIEKIFQMIFMFIKRDIIDKKLYVKFYINGRISYPPIPEMTIPFWTIRDMYNWRRTCTRFNKIMQKYVQSRIIRILNNYDMGCNEHIAQLTYVKLGRKFYTLSFGNATFKCIKYSIKVYFDDEDALIHAINNHVGHYCDLPMRDEIFIHNPRI